MIAGCYDLHLYCDGVDCARGRYGEQAKSEYSGDETGAAARARARRAGWKLLRDGRCLCPGCKKAGVSVVDDDETTNLRPVTEEDVQTGGGLASFTVRIERDTADQPGVPYPKGARALGKRLRRTGVTRGRPSKEGRAAVASMVAHATRRTRAKPGG